MLDALKDRGYRVVGPTVRDQAIVYDDIVSLAVPIRRRPWVTYTHAARVSVPPGFFQFHGRSSSSLEAGWSLIRRSTSASQASGSMSLSLAVATRE